MIDPKHIDLSAYTLNKNDNDEQKVKLKDLIKRLSLILISLRIKPLKEVKIDLRTIKNVLLLRNDGLGDYVLSTPLVSALKKINPEIHIDVIASHRNAVLIEQDNNIRKVFRTGYKSRVLEFLKLSKQIRSYSDYDLMIATKHTKITNTALLFNLVSRKAIKAGFKIGSKKNKYTINTYKLTFNNILQSSNLKYAQLLKETLQLVSSEKITFGDPYLLNETFTKDNKKPNGKTIIQKILININGFEKTRMFSKEYIYSLVSAIEEISHGVELTFTSSPEFHPLLDKYVEDGILRSNQVGKYKLLELIKELPKFDLVVTPDTAITHFAAVLNVPQIIFYDKFSKFLEWSPETKNYIALVANGNINNISINEFKNAFQLIIQS